MFWEFTVYINDGADTWEGYGYWRISHDLGQLVADLDQMAESLRLGLAGHGFTELSTLEVTLQAVNPSALMRARILEAIAYREEMAGGYLLRWSTITPLESNTDG